MLIGTAWGVGGHVIEPRQTESRFVTHGWARTFVPFGRRLRHVGGMLLALALGDE
jgi:hypothetical protein